MTIKMRPRRGWLAIPITLLCLATTIPAQEVDDAEAAMLVKMRQEEKLARDVYLTLYERWGLAIFNNIANSEQSHMNAIKVLLDRYGIEDPVFNDERGVVCNAEGNPVTYCGATQ